MLYLLLLALAIPEPAAFKPLAKDDQVSVLIARDGDRPPWVHATHEIPAAADKVFAILAAFDTYESVFSDNVKTAKVLSRTDNGVRLHIVWPLPWPMKNRDAVVKYETKKDGEKFQIDWVHAPAQGDPSEGLRIEQVMGRTVIEPKGSDRSLLHYTYYGELGGDLPDFIKEGSFREEPVVYFNAVRKKLALPAVPSLK